MTMTLWVNSHTAVDALGKNCEHDHSYVDVQIAIAIMAWIICPRREVGASFAKDNAALEDDFRLTHRASFGQAAGCHAT